MEPLQAAMLLLETHGSLLAVGLGASIASLAAGFSVGAGMVALLPEDYLEEPEGAPPLPGHPEWMRVGRKIGKNLLGAALVGAGAALALPGIPGPGILTMVVGVTLLDIPGKRRVVQRVLGAPRVLAPLNRLRGRLGRPPLRNGAGPHDGAASAAPRGSSSGA